MQTRTEDAGDYGGTCDTCANGVVKVGHQQCPFCERRHEEVEAHIGGVADKRQALMDHYTDIATDLREKAEHAEVNGRTVQYLDNVDVEREWRRVVCRHAMLCGAVIYEGDYVKVRYTTGKETQNGVLTGIVTKVWPNQAQVNNAWCFHADDELLEHSPGGGA